MPECICVVWNIFLELWAHPLLTLTASDEGQAARDSLSQFFITFQTYLGQSEPVLQF
jgi:hypothetical protein